MREKKLSNTNLPSLRHIKRKKASLPFDEHCSKRSLLKLPNISFSTVSVCTTFVFNFSLGIKLSQAKSTTMLLHFFFGGDGVG